VFPGISVGLMGVCFVYPATDHTNLSLGIESLVFLTNHTSHHHTLLRIERGRCAGPCCRASPRSSMLSATHNMPTQCCTEGMKRCVEYTIEYIPYSYDELPDVPSIILWMVLTIVYISPLPPISSPPQYDGSSYGTPSSLR